MRKLRRRPPRAVLLFEDETILRLLPEIRRAWSLRGEQARIPITGRNDKRVLFGALNLRTGHRIVAGGPNMRQEHFQRFLHRLCRSHPGREIWLILDEASAHTAPRSKALAAALNMVLIWLPKQCSELNAQDHLWRELKAKISANHQYQNIKKHAACATQWVLSLSKKEALRKAGILSQTFWLKSFLP